MAKLERTDKPVSVLLEELGEGTLGLPKIQRSYVWNRPLEEHLDELEDVYLAEETLERVRASRERVYTLAAAESLLSHRHSTRAFSLKN